MYSMPFYFILLIFNFSPLFHLRHKNQIMNVKIIRQVKSPIKSISHKNSISSLEIISENGESYEYDYLRQRSTSSPSHYINAKILQVGYLLNIQYILYSDHVLKFYESDQEVFEMPVNTLNFSNIIVFANRYDVIVISVSTTDPDKFDVYKINNLLSKNGDQINMERLLRLQSYTDHDVHTGNIMNFEYLNNILFVGYEDGSLIKYNMNKEFNQITEVKLLFDFKTFGDETHEDRDHPVLNVQYCENREILYFTHAKVSELCFYDFKRSKIDKMKLPDNISVNHLVHMNEYTYFSCWETNFIYQIDPHNCISLFYGISIKPNIQLVDIDPVADTAEAHPYKDLDRTLSKVSSMYKVTKQDIQDHYLGLESKVLMKRFSKLLHHDYLYIGLESGNLIELSFSQKEKTVTCDTTQTTNN